METFLERKRQRLEVSSRGTAEEISGLHARRAQLREELRNSGIAEELEGLLSKAGTATHLDELVRQWIDDRNLKETSNQ